MAAISNNTLNNAAVTAQTVSGGSTLPKQPLATENKIFKNQPVVSHQNADSAAVDSAVGDLDRLVNRLLNELKSSPSEAKLNELATQAKDLKVAPNLVKDMKNLVQMAEQEPELKDIALKLKEFLKPIADLKASSLNEQIKNSGIMLEANLKDALNNKFNLPSSINKLFGDIKNLSSQALLDQILTLAKDDSLSTAESFAKLNDILLNAKESNKAALENSPLKSLFNGIKKLEDAVKFMDKQASALQNGGLSLNDKTLDLQLDKVKNILSGLKLEDLQSEKLNKNLGFAANLKDIKLAVKSLEEELGALKNAGDKFADFSKSVSQNNETNLQDRLQSVAKKLNLALQIADKSGFEARNNLDEIGRLIKRQEIARQDIDAVSTRSSEDVAKSLQNDVKGVLLNLNSKAAPDSQIKDLSAKMLSQIEMHQLVSSVTGGIQSYLPYVWEGADGGNIRFKQGKKQKHYAQIDLNFQKFGQINIMVGLSDDKYIDLSIATQKEDFKELLLSGSKELKKAISDQGLIVSNFSLKTLPKLSLRAIYAKPEKLDMGFDKKI
jgi:flagellar hook-length control protein fliK